MLRSFLDHLVVTSPDLQSGIQFVEDLLGVTMNPGGRHTRMGTHNAVLRIGDRAYLEVIAIDPEAPDVGRERWFEIDRLTSSSEPRLATWVARTDDIEGAARAATIPPGAIEHMSRGALDWRITIEADGRLPFDGLAPALIEWNAEIHPVERMPHAGVSLTRLEMSHPSASVINAMLASIGFDHQQVVAQVSKAASKRMIASFHTPRGTVQMG